MMLSMMTQPTDEAVGCVDSSSSGCRPGVLHSKSNTRLPSSDSVGERVSVVNNLEQSEESARENPSSTDKPRDCRSIESDDKRTSSCLPEALTVHDLQKMKSKLQQSIAEKEEIVRKLNLVRIHREKVSKIF
jgi:hypothetical protein